RFRHSFPMESTSYNFAMKCPGQLSLPGGLRLCKFRLKDDLGAGESLTYRTPFLRRRCDLLKLGFLDVGNIGLSRQLNLSDRKTTVVLTKVNPGVGFDAAGIKSLLFQARIESHRKTSC